MCRDILNDRGMRGFFVGMTPTLAREVPGYFCFFGAYETSRYLLAKEGQSKDDIGMAKTALSGAIGGMALWSSIFPADVVKSRMQVSIYFSSTTSFSGFWWRKLWYHVAKNRTGRRHSWPL